MNFITKSTIISIILTILIFGCYKAEDETFCQDINNETSICKAEKEWFKEHKEHNKKTSFIEDCMNDWRNEREAEYNEQKLHKICEEKEKFHRK